MNTRSERLAWAAGGGGWREVCEGADSVSWQRGPLWGQQPGVLGVSAVSLPSACVFGSERQQLPGSLNPAKQTLRGTRGNKAN